VTTQSTKPAFKGVESILREPTTPSIFRNLAVDLRYFQSQKFAADGQTD
jgi:hypothetical protein